MTTIPDTTDNGQTALTMPQAIMLRTACEDGYIPTSYSDSQSDDKHKAILSLIELGLLKQSLDHFVVPTAKGRAVLAAQTQAASEPKPDTVTWNDFVAEGNEVFAAWSKRLCVVRFKSKVLTQIDEDDGLALFDSKDERWMSKVDVLDVLWLPSAPVSATAGGESLPTVVCLCGSTRFSEAFQQANFTETLAGRIVLTIGCDMKSDNELFKNMSEDELTAVKVKLDKLHFQKIELADEVLILNFGGYIGESTKCELAYAKSLNKGIRYLEAPGQPANGDGGQGAG